MSERASSEFFPPFLRALPAPDSPVAMDAHIVPSEHVLTMFYEIDHDLEVPEHAHGAQWGVVLAGEMELEIEGRASTYRARRHLLRARRARATSPASAPATRGSTSSPTPTATRCAE